MKAMIKFNFLVYVLMVSLLFSAPILASTDNVGSIALPSDKILRISESTVDFEYHGIWKISDEIEAFHHWQDDSWSVPLGAVLVGFEDVVATVRNGEIIKFDVYDPLYIRNVRVAISTGDFTKIEHEEIHFSPTSRLYIEERGTGRGFNIEKGEVIKAFVQEGDLHLTDSEGNVWRFEQNVNIHADPGGMIQIDSFQRGTTLKFYPQYRGRFELTLVDEKHFLAINEISLEEYLYQVVPSEMIYTWPLEALKAQAVAARTYAVAQVIYSRRGHLGYHVSDNTNSQVYNNQPERASTTQAIKETDGQILIKEDGTISSTYYHSTSPRTSLTANSIWKNRDGLSLEGNSPWYRWQCTLDTGELQSSIQPALPKNLGEIVGLEIDKRDEMGRVIALRVLGTEGKEIIEGELNIRYALKPPSLDRINDTLRNQSLLPSAFFFFEEQYDSEGNLKDITFYGGGSGHGLGMSQWGAKGMAEAEYNYLDILGKYYPESILISHLEQLRY